MINKKTVLGMLFLSPSVLSSPYFGFEYGIATLSHDYETQFHAPDMKLSIDDSAVLYGGHLGYRWNRYGLELGYREFEGLKDSSSVWMGVNQGYRHNIKSLVTLKVKQLILKPVYFHSLTDTVVIKSGIGVVNTKYDYKAISYDEYLGTYTHQYNTKREGSENKQTNELGIIASIGFEYQMHNKLRIGAGFDYYIDREVNASSLVLTTRYQF